MKTGKTANPKLLKGKYKGIGKNSKCSVFSWLKTTKIPPQNLVLRLFHRELNIYPKGYAHSFRKFYQNITPNFTVTNVQKPPCVLRKFTPDGRYLIAFSSDQTSLEIYQYRGPSALGEVLQGCKDEEILTDPTFKTFIEKNIFDNFFRLKHSVTVASNREQLNRECSLFTDDGKYVIVGSVSLRNKADLDDNYRTNESVTPNPRSPLDDYTLHIIDIELGILMDTRTFYHDKIFLSHNQGLYLYAKTLAVLSVQHQTIHIFEITPAGTFIDVRSIGRVCYEDDEFVLSNSLQLPGKSISSPWNHSSYVPSYVDGHKTIYSLKHRLLVFMYRYAHYLTETKKNPNALLEFYRLFNYFTFLQMWKMQLLDESHLLIKYAYEEVVTLRAADPNGQPTLLVIYNMITTEIVAVYENTSNEFLTIFERLSDFFRNERLSCESRYINSLSNNIWARLTHERHKSTIVSAKGGGLMEATKRLFAQLPIPAQSYSASPYLDLDIFSYDDKWVSVLDRPKSCADHPIRFYVRNSGLLKFNLYAGRTISQLGYQQPFPKRLVAFMFHPTDPFIISVQRANDEYVVSFHIRHRTS